MLTIAPNISSMKQIRNRSDVVHESNYEQEFTGKCVIPRPKARQEEFPTQAPPVPGTEPVEKKQGIAKREVVFARSPLARRQILSVVAYYRTGNVHTLPACTPEPPTQVDVLAIHKEKMVVESAGSFKGRSPDQGCRAGTPC